MKNALKLFGSIAIVAAIGFSMIGCGDVGNAVDGSEAIATTQNVRWEYMVVDGASVSKIARLMPRVNELGDEGWELIAVSGMTSELIFKRRLP